GRWRPPAGGTMTLVASPMHAAPDQGAAGEHVWQRLQAEVIRPGLCTHCGLCVGLSGGALTMQPSAQGPLPAPTSPDAGRPVTLPAEAYLACPGKGLNYPDLNDFLFGGPPPSWLSGHVRSCYLGYAADPAIRRAGASG